MEPPAVQEHPPATASCAMNGGDTVLLAHALQAASALNEGAVDPEEGRCQEYPWLIDASKVIEVLQRRQEAAALQAEAPSWWPGFSQPSDALIASCSGLARVPRLSSTPCLPVTA